MRAPSATTNVAAGGTFGNGTLHLFFLKPFNNAPVFSSLPTASVPENTTIAMTVTVADPDVPPQTLAYSIVGGADQARLDAAQAELGALERQRAQVPQNATEDQVRAVATELFGQETCLAVVGPYRESDLDRL